MDVIEIDSSDSESDLEIGYIESLDKSFNYDVADQWRDTSERVFGHDHNSAGSSMNSRPLTEISNANFGNSFGSNGKEVANVEPHEPHVELSQGTDFEPVTVSPDNCDGSKSPSQHTQKRALPSYFQRIVSKPVLKPSLGSHRRPVLAPPHKDSIQGRPDNGSELDLDDIADDRREVSMNDSDVLIYENTDKRRRLPLSLWDGKSVTNTQPKATTENRGDGRIHDFHGKSYHSVGSNSDYGIRSLAPSSSMNGKTFSNTQPRVVTEGRGHGQVLDFHEKNDDAKVQIYNNAGTRRALPSSWTNGKSVVSSHPSGTSDAGNLPGLGEERRIEHDERIIYQEALQNLVQPKLEDDLAEGLLTVPLLKHQKIALAWMVQKETASVHCAGGILADDQGLGKTISMIALIQKQRSLQSKFTSNDSQHMKSEALNLDEDDDGVNEVEKTKQIRQDDLKRKSVASTSIHASHSWRPAAGTLVVCPATVLRQWARELDEKVTSSARLSVLIYHGGTRTKDPGDLAKHDVVLTTYSIVSNEVPKQPIVDDDDGEQRNQDNYELSSEFSANKKRRKTSNAGNRAKKKGKGVKHLDYDSGPLARVRWFRVILDEAQTIKNHRTQVARACSGLRAKRRWCLSGTPIQNSIDDLFSYFRFLKYDPYAVYSSFCSSIKYPISRNATHGYKKLQAVLRTIMLRRTKGTLINGEPIVKLPPKSICLKKVDFSFEERAFYLRLEADSRKQFKAYAAAGTLKQNYANILLMLLRLRQACDHPFLVKGFHSDSVGKDSIHLARQLPREMVINLLNQLEVSLAICGVCSDPPEDAVVTMCGHVFCYQCVSDRLTGDDNMCPAAGCRDILGTDSVFSRGTLRSCISDEFDNNATTSSACDEESSIAQSGYISSKISAVMEILNSISNPSSIVGQKECNGRDCCPDRACNPISEDSYFNSDDTKADICAHSNLQPEIPMKTIVFSQWTSMLDLLESSLNQSLMQYRRLDGKMSLASRDRAVKDFNTDPEVTVMIMSLKAGNLGLNMVAACHVILLDLWWNPTTEDQAVDRAHRIGQTRPVTVSRLTINDTVEDRILALQEEKRNMVSSAFGEDQSGSSFATRLTVEDLRYLFMV